MIKLKFDERRLSQALSSPFIKYRDDELRDSPYSFYKVILLGNYVKEELIKLKKKLMLVILDKKMRQEIAKLILAMELDEKSNLVSASKQAKAQLEIIKKRALSSGDSIAKQVDDLIILQSQILSDYQVQYAGIIQTVDTQSIDMNKNLKAAYLQLKPASITKKIIEAVKKKLPRVVRSVDGEQLTHEYSSEEVALLAEKLKEALQPALGNTPSELVEKLTSAPVPNTKKAHDLYLKSLATHENTNVPKLEKDHLQGLQAVNILSPGTFVLRPALFEELRGFSALRSIVTSNIRDANIMNRMILATDEVGEVFNSSVEGLQSSATDLDELNKGTINSFKNVREQLKSIKTITEDPEVKLKSSVNDSPEYKRPNPFDISKGPKKQ